MKNKIRTICAMLVAALMLSALPALNAQAYSPVQATLTFTDTAIEETSAGSGYIIEGTALTITQNGTFRITGSCSDGSIAVSKSLTNVTLILDGLDLTSTATAPLVVKKNSSVLLIPEGESTLTDNEDAATEETNENFEGAAIKVKSASTLTLYGSGVLNAVGTAKNGIKGGAESAFIMNGGTLNVTAANNGVAFDGSVTVNAGTLNVTSENDGVKSEPEADDTASAGTVTFNGGNITIRSQGDGVQAKTDLVVTNGTFDIQTMNGYQSTGYSEDTMSCKGLKATGTDDDTADQTCQILISGGTFYLDTIDDAIHSDAYAVIIGGTFYIYTGDDGVHADTSLTLGSEGGYERDPEIYIYSSYEGLESGTIYSYSGKYYVIASDDGVNAAGGSSNGTDPGAGGGGGFNPGGGPGGRPGPGGGGFNPGGETGNSDYSLNFYGGDFYVNCTGDGLDSNGALNMYGGTFTVLSQGRGGDNSPLDSDGMLLLSGATVLAAGTNPMNETPASSSQKYYVSTTQRTAGTIVNVSYNGSTAASEKLPRTINYLLYSSPSMTSTSCSVTTSTSVDTCKSNAFAHAFDDGAVESAATVERSGVMLYTCADCGKTERKTILQIFAVEEYAEDVVETVYTAEFVTGGHCSIDLYFTQNYEAPDETNVVSAIARNGDTGNNDGTGSGQINFRVVVEDGYEVTSVTVEGSYKNLKNISTEELTDLYRITKIESDLSISITTKKSSVPYDLNGDGAVDISDVTELLNLLSTGETTTEADIDFDGFVSIKDVTSLLNVLAGAAV